MSHSAILIANGWNEGGRFAAASKTLAVAQAMPQWRSICEFCCGVYVAEYVSCDCKALMNSLKLLEMKADPWSVRMTDARLETMVESQLGT